MNKTLEQVGKKVESSNFVQSFLQNQKEFIPPVDYSTASNFAFFGLAEKYYEDAIQRIYRTYPYDGSKKEKEEWLQQSTDLDKYIFDVLYPRTNGYVTIGNNWGTLVQTFSSYGAPATASYEYIQIKGGPNLGFDLEGDRTTLKQSKNIFENSNKWSERDKRQSNLEFNVTGNFSGSNNGITVEFWLKKNGFTTNSDKEVIFDLWNGKTSGSHDYGRLTIETNRTGSTTPFRVTLMSGTKGISYREIGTGPTVSTVGNNTWQHFSFTFHNTGSNLETNLYVNGTHDDIDTATSQAIGIVTGSLIANIGALRTAPSGTAGPVEGYGKLFSASLDEFRFWKIRRTGEQINTFWNTDVGGGSNTDDNTTTLGVYLKFNEGITQTASVDSVVLDYSGRVSNGSWTGYSQALTPRTTGSAIVESTSSLKEFKDPIVYSFHNDVRTLLEGMKSSGSLHDGENNAALWHTFPQWITEEDEEVGDGELKNLTQVLASALDNSYLLINHLTKFRNIEYYGDKYSQIPFTNKMLEGLNFVSQNIFSEVTDVEYFLNKDFEKNVEQIKRIIYQNIYNNLPHIYKQKGTHDSFRNLLRCFGIDNELVKLNLYSSGEEYQFRDNFEWTTQPKSVVNFYSFNNFGATVFQTTASSDTTNTQSFLSASTTPARNDFVPFTLEGEFIFPRQTPPTQPNYLDVGFVSSSLFGLYPALATNEDDLTWQLPNTASLQVYSVRERKNSQDVKFVLTGTLSGQFPVLTSSFFPSVYNDDKWNIAVSVRHNKFPYSNTVSGSALSGEGSYILEFFGVNTILDVIPKVGSQEKTFYLTSSLSFTQGQSFLRSDKRIYAGARRTNFTGSIQDYSDVQLSDVKAWHNYVPTSSIIQHSKFIENHGIKDAYHNFLTYDTNNKQVYIPNAETLALHWRFSTNTGSDANGEFFVFDESSGSSAQTGRYDEYGSRVGLRYPATGFGFVASDTGSIRLRYFPTLKPKKSDSIASLDMIQILADNVEVRTKETRPSKYVFRFEKSMYDAISSDILNYFDTILEFNNLIGEPVNRYRPNYKKLDKLRNLYFSKVANTPDLERFLSFYKWIDSSILKMLMQLLPASAKTTEPILNVVESHILERNKFQHKFPLLEIKTSTTGTYKGLPAYSWKDNHAPLGLSEEENGLWWQRLSALDTTIWPDLSSVQTTNRQSIASNKVEQQRIEENNPNKFVLKEKIGGSNLSRRDTFRHFLQPWGNNILDKSIIVSGSPLIEPRTKYNTKLPDGTQHPLDNKFYGFTVSTRNNEISGAGKVFVPFSFVSSSVSGTFAKQNTKNLAIVDIHKELYTGDKPVQGPFTREHVGGFQWRHVALNTSSDDRSNRAEKFGLDVIGNDLIVFPADKNGHNNPVANWSRIGLTQRFINTKNIHSTQSVRVLGNFDKNYQIVQTTGRTDNNIYNRRNNGISGTLQASSSFASGLIDYIPPRRDLTGSVSVIAVRFSAPGGLETSNGFLDPEANEFSAYNALPWRNYRNITLLNEIHTSSSFQYGIDNITSPISASDHKVPRNTFYRIEASGSSFTTASQNNNWYFQNAIPASDFGYTWIRKTAVSASGLAINNQNIPFRYSSASNSDGKHRSIVFLSASNFGSYYDGLQNQWFFGIHEYATDTTQFRPVDLVNLNTHIYEPITSSQNKLGYDNLAATNLTGDDSRLTVNYINKNTHPGVLTEETLNDISTNNPGLATILNSILLHRNGAGGWDVWKQTRQERHPVARYMRRNNIFSVATPPQTTQIGKHSFTPTKPFVFENFVESIIDKSSHPLKTIFDISGSLISFDNSYANNVNFFAENRLNVDTTDKKSGTNYVKLRDLYVSDQPKHKFVELRYKETILPTRKYANLNKNRSRISFQESGGYGYNGIDRNAYDRRSFWPDSLERTSITGSTPYKNACDYRWGRSVFPLGNSLLWHQETQPTPPPTPWLFVQEKIKTGSYDGELSVSSTSSVDKVPYVDTISQGLFGSASAFLSGSTITSSLAAHIYDFPTASLQYVYLPNVGKFTEYSWPFDIYRQAKKGPWYNSYEDFAQDVRLIGQGYSNVAEYRISQHIEDYVNRGFFQENNDFLSLEGAFVSASSESSTGSLVDEFFAQYTNSDVMKHLNDLLEDHREIDSKPKHISITCKAVKKLLPYNGFYPINRTTQLGSLFSQSLGPNISGTFYSQPNSGALALQALLQPFFAPGIVFNTIKSGIAVDWPFFTGSQTNSEVQALYQKQKFDGSAVAYDPFVLQISSSGLEVSFAGVEDYRFYLLSSSHDSTAGGVGKFHGRMPFESLVNLSNTLLPGTNIYHMAPDKINQPSASAGTRYAYFNWNGQKKPFYEMAMNNFLAEIPKFFLKENNMVSFVSLPEKNFKPMEVGKTYYMDVVLRKSSDMNMVLSHYSASVASGASGVYDVAQSYHGRYFGPPSFKTTRVAYANFKGNIFDLKAWHTADPAYAPFTPPYFYGPAIARVSFTPNATRRYSVDEIFANCIASGTQIIPTDLLDETIEFAQNNGMPLESSISIFKKENSLKTPDSTGFDSWKIVPKFECPTLNFTNPSTEGENPESGYQQAFTGKGMWGTYGEIPSGSTGIFLSLEESFPASVFSNTTASTTIGSLIDVCGFQPAQKRIGELADSVVLEEAIIAIPYTKRKIRNSIKIGQYNFLKTSTSALNSNDNSAAHMMKRIQNYYLPPFMDFTNPESKIEPFVFYLFEFQETLDKQDLADIWQGVMPKPAMKATKQDITFKHPISDSEALSPATLYPDMQWLIFKLKKRARRSYNDLFANSDIGTELKSDISQLTKNYNYNWPYDFFSLVELAKFDVEVTIG